MGDEARGSITLNNISQIYYQQNDHETALSYLFEALEASVGSGNNSGVGNILINISLIFQDNDDSETALSLLQQAHSIAKEIGDKSSESVVLNNLSQFYHDKGDYQKAMEYLKQSLQITQNLGNKYSEGTILNNISQIYDAVGDHESSLSCLQQSLDIQQEIGDFSGLCFTKINIGHIQWQNEQKKDAYKSWAGVYKIAKEINLAQALEALTGLAKQLEFPNGIEDWEKYLAKEN